MIDMQELTPLMKQYQGIKERHRDAIVLFRLGDFYEMFGDDAKTASKLLQIALTTRDKGKEDPMPMCGIPYFASESYITKLIKSGQKVVVCEQTEDPKEAKGIVRREVVRVITPGTHTPEHPKSNNFIMSVAQKGSGHGIALADVSTGEFYLYETIKPLDDELMRHNPAEILLPEGLKNNIHYAEILSGRFVSTAEDSSFLYEEAYRALLKHFRVASLEGFGCEGMIAAISAAGALVSYLDLSYQGEFRFRKISSPNQASFMFLDAATQKNLELSKNLKDSTEEGTLLMALDETLTAMGGRFLRSALLKPLTDLREIRERQSAVKYLFEDYELIEWLRRNLRNIQDIERLARKIDSSGANPRDLIALKNSINHLPPIKSSLSKSLEARLNVLSGMIPDLQPLASLIDSAVNDHPPLGLRDGGFIKDGFDKEIDELRGLSVNAKDYISAMEAQERKLTGISTLKVGYNRIHGYYIEVTKPNLGQVPSDRYMRKQTLVGAERFITNELKEYESRVLGAEEKLKALESKVYSDVIEKARIHVSPLESASASIAQLDFLVSMAVVAKRHNYSMPKMTDESVLEIKNGRHPVLERLPMADRFIPNDTAMDGAGNRIMIITGPNMAGKSTYMRQVALITLMAQMGGFVPADEATIGIADRIFTRIGASDYLTKGQSTFMVEMIETANILNNATEKSLIVLDEIGRGTSTFDGISIAWAAASHIASAIKARTLFATHYNELTELAKTNDGVKNFNVAVKEWGEEIIFLRRIEQGPADKSYGIQVARLAGLPGDVVKKAREILEKLEKQHLGDPVGKLRQMDLFSAGEQGSVIDELKRINPGKMSPQDALVMLKAIKGKYAP